MMDIEYLLFLQNFREATNNIFTPFLEWLSLFSITGLIFVPIIIYWCISKQTGFYIFMSFGISRILNGIAKPTVCAYRPWVRDARIIPAGDSIRTATGYSFPSGHTMTATPILGSIFVTLRKSYKLISFLCLILIILVGFSRNYLGVHTPQDVLVGFILGALAIYLAGKVLSNPEHENLFFIAGLIICAVAVTYAKLKNYPMDYVDGKLLVDPLKMIGNTFGDAGILSGVIIGRWVEKKFIKFQIPKLNFSLISCVIVGLVIYAVIDQNISGLIKNFIGSDLTQLVRNFTRMFFVMALWPAVMKLLGVVKGEN